MVNTILHGNALYILKTIPDNSVDCCVTSPPYWGLRDYGEEDQLGLEKTPEEYVDKITSILEEVKRVLKPEGTLWLNLGDSYASGKSRYSTKAQTIEGGGEKPPKYGSMHKGGKPDQYYHPFLKDKDLVGIPWRVAFSLQQQGWWLRQDIIWHKPNPMPESVKDRCTKSHEYIFLLSKSAKYYFDHEAIQEEANYDGRKDLEMKGSIKYPDGFTPNGDKPKGHTKSTFGNRDGLHSGKTPKRGHKTKDFSTQHHGKDIIRKHSGTNHGSNGTGFQDHSGYSNLENPFVRNKRSVWSVPTKPFSEAHFATFPEALIKDCILAGCPEEGVVLDPFMGAGTTALVSRKLNRNYLGIEINEDYIKIANDRLFKELGIFL